jgi:CheY-like chemotaxis protein
MGCFMPSVLLIDDDVDVRDAVKKVLIRSGYDVAAVSSAEDGINEASSRGFDVVITDIIMPGMNGVDAIKKIRKILPKVRILAISGGGNFGPSAFKPEAITTTAYLQAAAEAGADGILTKPFEKKELIERLDQLFEA